MGQYRLSLLAESDLQDIFHYTLDTWGYEQFKAYEQLLQQQCQELADYPQTALSKSRDLYPGCRSCSVGKHVIFYHQEDSYIAIDRILHQNMDVPRHFKINE